MFSVDDWKHIMFLLCDLTLIASFTNTDERTTVLKCAASQHVSISLILRSLAWGARNT